ncbi:MAG: hypothetical protein ACI8W7_000006 [Gammaproteobacteria bacterium]|jgi:hypothetical protein
MSRCKPPASTAPSADDALPTAREIVFGLFPLHFRQFCRRVRLAKLLKQRCEEKPVRALVDNALISALGRVGARQVGHGLAAARIEGSADQRRRPPVHSQKFEFGRPLCRSISGRGYGVFSSVSGTRIRSALEPIGQPAKPFIFAITAGNGLSLANSDGQVAKRLTRVGVAL